MSRLRLGRLSGSFAGQTLPDFPGRGRLSRPGWTSPAGAKVGAKVGAGAGAKVGAGARAKVGAGARAKVGAGAGRKSFSGHQYRQFPFTIPLQVLKCTWT